MNNDMKNSRIGVISINGKSGMTPLSNLMKIFTSFSLDLCLISGKEASYYFMHCPNVHVHKINHEAGSGKILRILKYFYTQLRISLWILKFTKNINIWVFFIGGDTLVLPMLVAKILRKKVILVFAGSSINTLTASNDELYQYLAILSKINCKLCDNIILYSERLIQEWKLGNYKNKIVIMHRHFIDFGNFNIITEFDKRNNLVGYIGRLTDEKGIKEFVESIPKLISSQPGLEFLICGNGNLNEEISKFIWKNNLNSKVRLIPWVSHQEIPLILNQLKLLVLPSYTEGLPNIIIESMACGTPVLATGVGAIHDVIENEKTGFILENNSSECIKKNIIDFIRYEYKEELINASLNMVQREFNYEKVILKWKAFFEKYYDFKI